MMSRSQTGKSFFGIWIPRISRIKAKNFIRAIRQIRIPLKALAFFCTAWRVVCDKDITCNRLRQIFRQAYGRRLKTGVPQTGQLYIQKNCPTD